MINMNEPLLLELPEIIPGELTKVNIDANDQYRLRFKGSEFLCTSCGSLSPANLYTSLSMENHIRERWWNIKKGDFVLDIGSSFGSYTLTALALGAELVIAADPDRWSYFDLETNILLNGYHQKCLHINFMFGDNVGLTDYFAATHSNRKEGESKAEFRLTTTIDRTIFSLGLNKLDWIKIDVEGMELEVLKGGIEVIKQFKPKLLIENHECFIPGVSEQVRSFLLPLGYKEEKDVTEKGCWSLWEND